MTTPGADYEGAPGPSIPHQESLQQQRKLCAAPTWPQEPGSAGATPVNVSGAGQVSEASEMGLHCTPLLLLPPHTQEQLNRKGKLCCLSLDMGAGQCSTTPNCASWGGRVVNRVSRMVLSECPIPLTVMIKRKDGFVVK